MRVVEDRQGVASATRLPTVVGGAAKGEGEASAARLPTKEGGDDEGEASAARAEGLPCNIPPLPNPSAPSSLVPLNLACEDPIVLERLPPRRNDVHDVAPCSDVFPAPQSLQTEAPASEYLPATQSSHAVPAKPSTLHVPVKPLLVTEPSDVKVTLRKPVVDV